MLGLYLKAKELFFPQEHIYASKQKNFIITKQQKRYENLKI